MAFSLCKVHGSSAVGKWVAMVCKRKENLMNTVRFATVGLGRIAQAAVLKNT
jgi:hypothetical protein